MLSNQGLRLLSEKPQSSHYEKYHDILYAMRHFPNGIGSWRLPGICQIEEPLCYSLISRGKKIAHLEGNKWKNCRITEKGIEYNNLWFSVQDRFNARDLVSSAFIIYDIPLNKTTIENLIPSFFNSGFGYELICRRMKKKYRSNFMKYLDVLRLLRKYYPKSISPTNATIKASLLYSTYQDFRKNALEKGHIELEGKKDKLTPEGSGLVNAIDWLSNLANLTDLIPVQVTP